MIKYLTIYKEIVEKNSDYLDEWFENIKNFYYPVLHGIEKKLLYSSLDKDSPYCIGYVLIVLLIKCPIFDNVGFNN